MTTFVRELMGPPAPSVHRAESVVTAARRLRAHAAVAVPVCGDNDEYVGMLTSKDIIDRCVADGRDPRTMAAGELITAAGSTVHPDDDAGSTVLDLILGQPVPMLPVVRDGVLVGLITLDAIAAHLVDTIVEDDDLELGDRDWWPPN
jgi:CBS domain-containing protein